MMKRPSVMKLKRQFGTNAFFLTTFFGTHFPCAAINKEYVGIELDPNYFGIAKNRIENEPTQLTLTEQKDK